LFTLARPLKARAATLPGWDLRKLLKNHGTASSSSQSSGPEAGPPPPEAAGQPTAIGGPQPRDVIVEFEAPAQRQRVHNRDMTQERRHLNGHGLATAAHWVRSHLPRWPGRRTRPPTAGVREPRRPRPTLPAAAVALKEPRALPWIKLRNRHPGERT
jgi:hypothetical protein